MPRKHKNARSTDTLTRIASLSRLWPIHRRLKGRRKYPREYCIEARKLKIRYPSEQVATRVAHDHTRQYKRTEELKREYGYRCTPCKSWHVTSNA